uniref:Uncharacterized protein n=1 Tax=Anguilla anguilla TaxID=7936 RepID=A0A0E9TT86_ANGAN
MYTKRSICLEFLDRGIEAVLCINPMSESDGDTML